MDTQVFKILKLFAYSVILFLVFTVTVAWWAGLAAVWLCWGWGLLEAWADRRLARDIEEAQRGLRAAQRDLAVAAADLHAAQAEAALADAEAFIAQEEVRLRLLEPDLF